LLWQQRNQIRGQQEKKEKMIIRDVAVMTPYRLSGDRLALDKNKESGHQENERHEEFEDIIKERYMRWLRQALRMDYGRLLLLMVRIVPYRQRLTSDSSERLEVRSFRLAAVVGRAFPVSGANMWTELSSDVTPAPSFPVFIQPVCFCFAVHIRASHLTR